MNDAVIDSSVILAILKNEAIDEEAYEVINRGVISSINLAEVYSKLAQLQMRSTPNVDVLLGSMTRAW